ncbi:MAG: fumarylacetoacetate hydrolase family protein, partial [Erysipelotrichaceae bacterium]|nr:fumarylacetoacetate hydrolase family protein [Erysipelotrichaceae bacterium]
ASCYLPLSKGDLIYTGTPSGVALEQESGYLKDGDVIEIDIEGIGCLRNQVKMIR